MLYRFILLIYLTIIFLSKRLFSDRYESTSKAVGLSATLLVANLHSVLIFLELVFDVPTGVVSFYRPDSGAPRRVYAYIYVIIIYAFFNWLVLQLAIPYCQRNHDLRPFRFAIRLVPTKLISILYLVTSLLGSVVFFIFLAMQY